MRFTLRQLEYAVAVGRLSHFGQAARACHVSQPALSSQLKELETALGGTLFDRSGRKVQPTAFGRRFLPRAEALLERALALDELGRKDGGELSGALALGALPTVAPYVLPPALPALAEQAPDLRLRLVEASTHELCGELRQGDLDTILLSLEEMPAGFETAPVFEDPFLVAVGPTEARDLPEGMLSLEDLPQDRLLVLDEPH